MLGKVKSLMSPGQGLLFTCIMTSRPHRLKNVLIFVTLGDELPDFQSLTFHVDISCTCWVMKAQKRCISTSSGAVWGPEKNQLIVKRSFGSK